MVIDIDELQPTIVGTIKFSDPIDEENIAYIGLSGLSGVCTVEIFPREGQIPHCHIKFKGNTGTCVKLYEADYFLHGPYKLILNAAQKKDLNDWMLSEDDSGNTNWAKVCDAWWLRNPNCLFSKITTTPPDYNDLP